MENSSELSIRNPIKEIPPDLKKLVNHIERSEDGLVRHGDSYVYDLALSKGWIQEGDIIYDLGCGDGSQFPKLDRAVGNGKIYGIDITPNHVTSAKKVASKFSNIEVYQMDARKIEPPLNYNGADKVFVSDVLGMVPKESANKILDESILAAKPKGKIIASMDSKEFFRDLVTAFEAPKQFSDSIENDQYEYAPGLVGSMFTEEEIRKSSLGKKCTLEIHRLPHKFIDPMNMLGVPKPFLDKTEKYLVLATKN